MQVSGLTDRHPDPSVDGLKVEDGRAYQGRVAATGHCSGSLDNIAGGTAPALLLDDLSVERVNDDNVVERVTTIQLDLFDFELYVRTGLSLVQVVRHVC